MNKREIILRDLIRRAHLIGQARIEIENIKRLLKSVDDRSERKKNE